MISSGYSLWLVDHPTSRLHQQLNNLIQEAAARYDVATFQSHVTLLSGLNMSEDELRQRTANVASQMRPVPIRLERFGSDSAYFQRLFALVTVNDKLRPYRLLAEETFGLANNTPYWPRHSFVYGDLSPDQVQELERYIARELVLPQSFLAQNLELWRTEGPVSEWRLVHTYPLFPRVD